MKNLLLNIIFCLSAFAAAGQSVYEIVPEPTCWFISNQDSSLTRYLLVSSRTPGQISILGYVNAAGDVVDVSAGGFFTPGFCDCCNGSGSGSGDQDWLWPTTDKTNLNPIYHIGKVSVFTQDTTHGLRVDSDFQFNPEALTTFDYQNLTDTTGTNYRGILFRAPGTFSGSSTLSGGSNNLTIAKNAVPADRDRLGVYAFGGKLTGVPDVFESSWIEAFADGNWTGTNRSSGINFYVTDTSTTYNILTMEKGGRIELDKYGSFSDGTPLSILGFNSTSKDITRHPISGTALPGYLLGLDDVGGFVWKDSAAYISPNYWTLSGANIFRNSNVGIGVDPSTSSKFIVRGNGNTSGTINTLIEDSAGNDLFTINDIGDVSVRPSFSGNSQFLLGNNVNFNHRFYFGSTSGGLLQYGSSIFKLGTASSNNNLFFNFVGNYPALTVGGSSDATTNHVIRVRGSSNFNQISANNFSHFISEAGTTYTNSSTGNVSQFRANGGMTFVSLTGAHTGYANGFSYDPTVSMTPDTSLAHIKPVGFAYIPSFTLSSNLRNPIIGFLSAPTISGFTNFYSYVARNNTGWGYRSEGSATNWFRGNTAIGVTSTVNAGNTLEIYGRTGTDQFVGQGTSPSINVDTVSAGTGATASINTSESSDLAGRFSVTTGSGSVEAGSWVTIVFNTTFSVRPTVVLYPDSSSSTTAGDNAATLTPVSTLVTTSGFSVRVGGDPSGAINTTCDFQYQIIGGK